MAPDASPRKVRPTRRDKPLEWGRAREMNAIEAMMWRGEVVPQLRSTITSFAILDCAPEWERFVDACDWATRMAPRFRQKVVEPSLGLGTPRWVNDPDFDLHYHLRRIRPAGGATWREALLNAEQLAMTPFDRARAPWEVMLIEGLPDDRAALVTKLHHSTTDGLGATQLFGSLFSRQREHNPDKPQPAPPPPEWVHPSELLRDQLGREARSAPLGLFSGAEMLARGIRDPLGRLREARAFAESAARVLSDPGAPGSPLLAERSLKWRFLAFDMPFEALRSAAKAAAGTLNDAYLASLLGAFRLYHAKFGQAIETMPMSIPISVRSEDDPEGGNKFTGARFAGPVGIVDPAERIAAIGEVVRGLRAEPALDTMGLVAPLLARLPGPAIGSIAGTFTASNDLQASNVPGYR